MRVSPGSGGGRGPCGEVIWAGPAAETTRRLTHAARGSPPRMRTTSSICLVALLAAAPLGAQARLTPADSARHALNRLGYGPTPGQVEAVVREGVLHWVDRQLGVRDLRDPALEAWERPYAVLSTPMAEMVAMHSDQVGKAL